MDSQKNQNSSHLLRDTTQISEKDFVDRMVLLTEGKKPNPWASRFGWNRGLISLVFNGKQLPGPEALASLAQAERVNLSWLLTGEGAPYEVLPPPHWDRLALGSEVSYYLFASDGGLQLPLVQVTRPSTHFPIVQVYSGLPADFADSLDYLHRTRQPLYFAPDHPQVAELRKGWGSNRLLLGDDEQPGLLPEPTVYIDLSAKLPIMPLQAHNGSYLVNPPPVIPDTERDWLWALRGLDKEAQGLVLALVKRLGKGESSLMDTSNR